MARKTSSRIAAHVAIVKLRSLLATDSYIALRHRQELVELISGLADSDKAAAVLKARLIQLIKARFGRNPDTFEVSAATAEALQLLHSVQAGSSPGGRSPGPKPGLED